MHFSKIKHFFKKTATFLALSGLFLNFYLIDSDVSNYLASVTNIGDEDGLQQENPAKKRYLTYEMEQDLPVKRLTDKSLCTEPGIEEEVVADTPENAEEKMVPAYDSELIKSSMSSAIEPGNIFRVKIYLKNTGTRRWYGDTSNCASKLPVRLGTAGPHDRKSIFWTNYYVENVGWIMDEHKNRVTMLQDYIDPGETAIFQFWSRAPEQTGVYREFFQPVVEGVQWFDEIEQFYIDIPVGNVNQEDYDKIKFASISTNTFKLQGEKNFDINLSKQEAYIRYGNEVIHSFKVSTGARKTPTPATTWNIQFKQEVRVGAKYPHYIMPRYQALKPVGGVWTGYGLHCLPKLARDGGVFWTEALSHIGVPVSHGCVRMPDKDCEIMFDWTEEGTKVTSHY